MSEELHKVTSWFYDMKWMIVTAIISACIFYALYWFWLINMPDDPLFWDGFWKFLCVWFWNFVISVSVHLVFAFWKNYNWQISNVRKFVYQLVSTFIYSLFVIFGVYGWFLGLIPLAFTFDEYPWYLLLFTFIILKLIVFSFAYPISVSIARSVDESWGHAGESIGRAGSRLAYGKEKAPRKAKEKKAAK